MRKITFTISLLLAVGFARISYSDSAEEPRGASDAGPAADAGVVVSGEVPVIGGCAILPTDNAWNTRIDNTTAYPLNAMAATYLANMSPTTHLHPDWGDWSVHHYGIPWQVVPSTQSDVAMTFKDKSQSDPGPYPYPADALIEGGEKTRVGDRHVLVLQSGSCELFETWHSVYENPGWKAGSGAIFNLDSDVLRKDGWTSADAAGLPILPGLVKLAEVQEGAVKHAIRFTISSSQEAYIHPATHAAGSANTSLPPMGLRMRLKASFDTTPYSGPTLVILTAMKEYGIILADNGSDWYFTGDSNDGWKQLMSKLVSDFDGIYGSDFEAVDSGPLSTNGL